MLSSLLIAGKGLTSWPSFVMFNCVFLTFPCGILGQVCNLIVTIPDLCCLSYLITTVYSSFFVAQYICMLYKKE